MTLEWILLIPAFIALAYQAFALVASVLFSQRRRRRYSRPVRCSLPAISVLKPVHGLDDNLLEALRSNLKQDHPEFEVLIGIRSVDDPAWPILEQLRGEHPDPRLRVVLCPTVAPNGKIGVLLDLARQARHPVWLVNDADISVPVDYLRRVAAPLDDQETALVTCLYRPEASSWAGRFEALVIATDFIPSTLVAPMVGVREFGLGSTLCFRSSDLQQRGGFEALGDCIADDYHLAKALTSTGKRAVLSEVVVDTTLSDPGWLDVWRHQLRWARTIRVSRPGGFLGLPATHAGLWAVLCAAAGLWPMALALWLARSIMGAYAGFVVLRHWPALAVAPLLPLCDLWGFSIWIATWLGRTVWWRNRVYRLSSDGRILPMSDTASAGEQTGRVPEQKEEPAHRR